MQEHSGGNGTVSSRLGYMAFKVGTATQSDQGFACLKSHCIAQYVCLLLQVTASSEAFTEICEELQGVPAVDNLYFGRPKGSPR